MIRRWLRGLMLGFLVYLVSGCRPGDGISLDDTKNPDVTSGLAKVSSYQYDAAIEHFEKALVKNARSVRAHYELGLIYEKQKRDYVTAIYHYQRVLKCQDRGWPAENARLLIDGCRQELIKSEALAPVAQAMQQELDKLRNDNTLLKEQLAALKPGSPTNASASAIPQVSHANLPGSASKADPSRLAAVNPNQASTPARLGGGSRTHRVKPGETLASIGRSYQVSIGDMLAANPSVKPRSLAVGTVINIPSR